MEQNEYFAQVPDPQEVRKSLLSSSRQIIQVLQRMERIKQLRIAKLESINKVRNTNKEIRLLITKLKKEFPSTGMRIPTSPEKPAKTKRIRGNELQELENELKKIESKISQLS